MKKTGEVVIIGKALTTVPARGGQTAMSRVDRTITMFRRKAMVKLLRSWREFAGSARARFMKQDVRPELPKEDAESLRDLMRACINAKGGEISARLRTVELGHTYLSLNEIGKKRFLETLAGEFGVDHKTLLKVVGKLQVAAHENEMIRIERELKDALESPRERILRQFNALPNGFKFLVDIRADLMALTSGSPVLEGLEHDLKGLLSAWFDIGLLDLAEINWDSPAALLEKLMEYEAVHAIRSWSDLKNRLDSDRRWFCIPAQ